MVISKVFFKDTSLEEQFIRRLDPRLRAVVYDVAEFCDRRFRKQWIITDVGRDDPNSAHHYGRAVDCRSLHLAEPEIEIILDYLNSVWDADLSPKGQRTEAGQKKFLRVLYHKESDSAYHFHLAINGSHSRGDYSTGKAPI